MLRLGENLFHQIYVTILKVGIGNDVDEFSRLKPRDLGEHHDQQGILEDIPIVSSEHVVGSLIEDAV